MARPVDAVMAQAREFLGDRMTTNAALREQHSHGEDTNPPVLPDGVAFIQTTEEASRLLALCHAHRVPVVPFGAGTSLEGHVTPVRGGISLDLSRMTAILQVNGPDMDCRVQAGVTRQQLNAHLRDQGLFFPVDPGSECTLGGMCATRASGTNAVRYGTIRENVLGLTVVLADGRVVNTGGRVRKAATGYDLTRLFIGSEGTLGIMTEIQLRLHGIPEAQSAAICQFATLAGAVDTVMAHPGHRHPRGAHGAAGRRADGRLASPTPGSRGWTPVPTLFFEFDGTAAGVKEQAETAQEIAADNGAAGFRWATDARSAQEAVAGPARRLLGGARLPARLRRASRRTRSSRSAGWPTSSWAPSRTSSNPACPPRSWAMSATATSTPSSWCRRSRTGWNAPGRWTARSWPARSRWKAAAAASTASASASASSWSRRPGTTRWT